MEFEGGVLLDWFARSHSGFTVYQCAQKGSGGYKGISITPRRLTVEEKPVS